MRTEYRSFLTEQGPWVAVNTQPHRELAALANLGRQGYDAYCPMLMKRVRHARIVKDVRRPLFPSYLFVRVDPRIQRWRPILSTIGVRTIVCCGELPSLVDNAFIDSLKGREVGGSILSAKASHQVGDKVCLVGGAFEGAVARIVDMDERDRLVVLMDLLSRKVRVTVDADAVTAA